MEDSTCCKNKQYFTIFFQRAWGIKRENFVGMVLITLAVSRKPLHPQCTAGGDCAPATRQQVAFLYAALYTMAIGAGGTKPNISTFGADQFDDFDAREREVKASFFNWWLFSSFAGGLVAVLVLVYVQEEVGWGVGYTIPTVGLALSLVLFYVGTPFYRHKPVTRSTAAGPARLIGKVLRAAYANRGCPLTGELHEHDKAWYAAAGKRLLLHTEGNFRCLDKAAIREREACTVTEVEEVKLIAGMIVVWLVTLVPCTIWAQVNTLFVKQGTTLDRSVGGVRIPAASLGSFVTISMLSPEGMRSLGTTFFTSGLGAGNFLNSLLVTLVDRATATRGSWIGDNLNDSHLDYYYAFLLLLTVANMALFVWVAMRYKYKREFLEDSGAMETERETEMVAGGKAKADLPRLPDNTTRDRAYILE
uniref:Peptide transporter PTR3-A n=1 Tax=Aegilops tauschii TaxID=37682 RepID=M8D1A3_AEGTA